MRLITKNKAEFSIAFLIFRSFNEGDSDGGRQRQEVQEVWLNQYPRTSAIYKKVKLSSVQFHGIGQLAILNNNQ